MAIETATTIKIFTQFEGRIGIWSGLTPPTSYSDFVNFESIKITAPEQEVKKLISRMTSTAGTALDSQNVATDKVATVEIESSTFTPGMLEMMLGATVSEVVQTSGAVTDEAITTQLNVWVPLANQGIEASGIDLEIPDNTNVSSDKFQIDLELGLLKAIHADAVGTGVISYTKRGQTIEQYAAGLAKTTYVHLTGQATEKVTGLIGPVDIWRASLASAGAFDPVAAGGEYLKGVLKGDLITPSVAIRGAIPTSPWRWGRRTA
jgi:hypothetical protein